MKKKLEKKEAGKRGGTKMERKKRSQREGELKLRKWAREMKNEREGDLKNNMKRERYSESEGEL